MLYEPGPIAWSSGFILVVYINSDTTREFFVTCMPHTALHLGGQFPIKVLCSEKVQTELMQHT